MKKTVYTIFSVLFGSLFLYSCETCDNPTITATTAEDNKWLVYDYINYYNPLFENEQDSLIKSFKFQNFITQNVPGEGSSLTDDCIESLDTQVFAHIADTTKRYPALYTYILKRPDTLEVRVAIENRGDWAIDKENPTYETLEVNGFDYMDVYEINPDSVKANSVKQILFNKEYGFLKVDFYDGRQLRLFR
ncbi:hypothetical protein [Pontibacter fetidus]|uniref:Uncharacterized protein n=1 Tax=Pontibacter fetidus TaxID=2700082 RepID=A0A6B2HAA8_9BACT|nr:hypothetical protein [Pontibacter fetidus]NDK56562.1 hypothetical protein [Pontibacter fetidus]